MPQIDQEKIDEKKVMDIAAPPMKPLEFQQFPQMVYLHPKDKSLEHKSKIVKNQEELDQALKQGYRVKPHIPVAPEPEIDPTEYDVPSDDAPKAKKS